MATKQDVLNFAEEQAAATTYLNIRQGWLDARKQFNEGGPDQLATKLRSLLHAHETSAKIPASHISDDRRTVHEQKAGRVLTLLWQIADEYGAERIWGSEFEARQAQQNTTSS